jgi:hypothetical protein
VRSAAAPALFGALLLGACASDDAAKREPPTAAPTGDDATDATDAGPADRSAEARRALHLDGLDSRADRLAGIGGIVARSFRGALLRDPDQPDRMQDLEAEAFLANVRESAREVYEPDGLRASLTDELVAREADGQTPLDDVIAWFESDIANVMREGRLQVSTPAGQKALGALLAQLPTHPPDEARLERVRALVEASRQAELFMALSFDTSSDLMEALVPHLPASLGGGADEFLMGQKASRQRFSQRVTRTLLFQDWYALRKLSDDELDRAVSFWTSPSGRWYASARLEAVRAVSRDRARAIGERLSGPPG